MQYLLVGIAIVLMGFDLYIGKQRQLKGKETAWNNSGIEIEPWMYRAAFMIGATTILIWVVTFILEG